MDVIAKNTIVSYEIWTAAIASSACIGLTSLVPWLFNHTFFETHKRKASDDSHAPEADGRMKYMLSFAIGAILGDIFFHLIPESYQSYLIELNDTEQTAYKKVGLSVIAGIFMFIIVEMVLAGWSQVETKCPTDHHPAGYLSLIANGFDNFTHGLAIGASFLVGVKVGVLTTVVIFIHEIPHEICDYAILVKSGFSRWDALRAQSTVSLFGVLGTTTSLYVKSIEALNSRTCWILPFSAGGFLYIALVNLLPEVLDSKTDIRNSIRQIGCLMLGISFMAAVTVL